LRVKHRAARIAPQAGEIADALGEDAVVFTDETDVAIVQFAILDRHRVA